MMLMMNSSLSFASTIRTKHHSFCDHRAPTIILETRIVEAQQQGKHVEPVVASRAASTRRTTVTTGALRST